MASNFLSGSSLSKGIGNWFSWPKNQSFVGIDIGSSSIKTIQLRKEKEQAVLETYGELATGPYSGLEIGQVTRVSEDKLAEMLRDLFKEAGVNAKKGAVAIPLKSSFVTTIKLPFVEGKEMNEVIKYEARKYIPVSPEEIEMDYWVLPAPKIHKTIDQDELEEGESEKEKKTAEEEGRKVKKIVEVLLVAIHKETLEKYRVIISKAGLKSVSFEIEIFSALRSSLSRQTAPIMTMDFGAASTKMCIVDSGVLRVAHNVDKGSQDLTNAIARSLTISFARAEDLKFQVGISARPEHKELVGVMEPTLNLIFSEARQMMLDYRRKNAESVGRIILTGGGSLLKNFLELAVKNLGVEVSLADPFVRTNYPPFLQEVLKEVGPAFAVSTGVALMGI